MGAVEARRLGRGDRTAARDMFAMMADVFGEAREPLGDDYIDSLLGHETFWAFAAFVGPDVVGGLTAHLLPMTRSASSEVFIYDLAVRPTHRRQGVGSRLIRELREAAAGAGITEIFVPADNDDEHALDFYRAQAAIESPVTFFTLNTS